MLVPQRQAGCQRGVIYLHNSCRQGGAFASDLALFAKPTRRLMNSLKRPRIAQTKERMELLETVPLLIIDDLGMRKLPLNDAEETVGGHHATDERAGALPATNFLL